MRLTHTLPLLAAAAISLAACGSDSQPSTADEKPAKPTNGGTISYGHQQEPPCLSGGWVEQAYISRQTLDSLVSQDANKKIVPWLAQSWKVSDDQKTWTFKLKPGVKFTDGTPLNAEAIKTNFETWLNPKSLNSTVFVYIGEYYQSSKAVDDLTFQLKLAKPYSPLLEVLAQGYFGIHSPKQLAKGVEANCEKIVGTGAYKVDSWERGKQVTFSKNPNYNSAPANAKHQGPAYADKLIWKFLKEPAVRYGSLKSGQSQVIYDIPSVEWKDAKENYQVLRYLTPGRPQTLTLNTSTAPFDDVKVRQALAYALDREESVKSAFGEAAEYNGNGSLSQSTPNHDAVAANAYKYDPAKAAQLLDEAGWKEGPNGIRQKDGKPLKIVVTYGAGSIINSDGATLLQTLQQQAKESGFDWELKPLTLTQLFGGEYSAPDKYNATPGYWTSPTAGVLYITWRENTKKHPNPSNNAYYNNPQLVKTIAAANSTLDPTEQRQLYAKAQRIISDNSAAIGLYTRTSSLAIDRDKLRDVWQEQSQGEPVFSDAYLVK
ncbi:MAG: ABC transporter substrate-binding protein [Solirubrobacteraceae bacterium]|nr:ABC transporter substrate-binding protein [Solirubrobacteraceae bacterium]